MKAAILTVGTELVRGEIVDENAAWLASRLTSLGIDVVERCSVGDEKDRIAAAMTRLASQADVLLVTGGLGPTADDVTTEAAALALGVPLETDPAVLERIRQRWAARGRPMPPNNERQAMRPAGSRPIANPTGTAPGFSVTLGGCRVHVLPGVPSEMHRMYTEGVLPELSRSAPRNAHLVSLRVYGLAESEIDDRLADIERLEPGVRLGFRVRYPEVEVTIAARAENAAVAAVRAHAVASMVRARLGDAVYGEDGERLAAVVGRALRDRGWRLAVAESCTGGLLGALITSVPGSSDYLLLDAVVYSNASKQRVLGVPDELLRACGAVSAEVAQAMAEGALRIAGADVAVAVTGIAGPGGGTDGKPVGTVWLALATTGEATRVEHRLFHGDRERIQQAAAHAALWLVGRAASARPTVSGERI